MKLRTFLFTYLLFLSALFLSVGVVSVYMTNNQINMLKEKSLREFQTVATVLSRDMENLYQRAESSPGFNFYSAKDVLIRGYVRYYQRHNITLTLERTLQQDDGSSSASEMNSYADIDMASTAIYAEFDQAQQLISTSGHLPLSFGSYHLSFASDISDSIAEMQGISRVLLLVAVCLSLIAALMLYFILSRIFKPLEIISGASKRIAGGSYGERITIACGGELAAVADDFNTMTEKTEQQMRQLEDESSAKQQFVDSLAHEIRTPLTSIYGYAEYIEKAPFDELEARSSAQNIMDEAAHVRQISDSLLKLAILRDYIPTKEKVSSQALFEDVEQTLQKEFYDKGVVFTHKSDDSCIYGQEDLLKMLLLNLCGNALAACEVQRELDAQRTFHIHLEAQEQEGTTMLSIEDNGCGIANEDIVRIVKPFYRSDKARTRKTGGAGIGLALCQQILEVHEAHMNIQSELSCGTKIEVTFTTS
jgi:signal transduction histidine kinase